MSYTHLTLEERYVIYHLVLYGLSLREIGRLRAVAFLGISERRKVSAR